MSDTATESLPTVHQLISKVKGDIGAVGKDREMKDGPRYSYRGVDDILNAAHEALVQHGVFWVPWCEDGQWSTFMGGKDNKKEVVRVVHYVQYKVYGPRGDYFEARVPGEAQDFSDKAANKTLTGAEKILLSQIFAIPYSTEDPDDTRIERGENLGGIMPTEEQWKGMMDVLKALPGDVQPWVKTWRESRDIPIKYGEINAAEVLAILSFVDGLHAVFDHANGDGTVSPPPKPANGGPAAESPTLMGDGVTNDTAAVQAHVNAGVRVNKTHLDTLIGLAGQLPKEGAQSQAALKKWRYEQGITGSPETWTVAQWEQVMSHANSLLGNRPIDLEFRGYLGGRLANLGPEYEAVFQEHLDGLDSNPVKGRPWRQQLDRIPSSFDDEMRDAIDMLVQSHAVTNPSNPEVLDGGEAF